MKKNMIYLAFNVSKSVDVKCLIDFCLRNVVFVHSANLQ